MISKQKEPVEKLQALKKPKKLHEAVENLKTADMTCQQQQIVNNWLDR